MSHNRNSIVELINLYRIEEGESARGPLFADVAYAIEEELESRAITKRALVKFLGPPDLFDNGVFVYRFDHKKAGKNRDEWYFHIKRGKVFSSGFNRRGINDLSRLKDRSEFPNDRPG